MNKFYQPNNNKNKTIDLINLLKQNFHCLGVLPKLISFSKINLKSNVLEKDYLEKLKLISFFEKNKLKYS
jgi:hypothetical protein